MALISDESGRVFLSPTVKYLLSGIFLITVGWLSWASLSIIQLKDDVFIQNKELQNTLTAVAGDVQWMKNEAQQGRRFTYDHGQLHGFRITNLEEKLVSLQEKLLKMKAERDASYTPPNNWKNILSLHNEAN